MSYDALIVNSVAKTLCEYPILNSSFEKDQIRVSKEINVGVAVATNDELIVVVIKNADKKEIRQISDEVTELAEKARSSNLNIAEVSGGTFTVSNLGVLGVEGFTPIIVPGQSGILGVGALIEKPTVKDGRIEIGSRFTLNLTFDHRVTDGAVAAKFLDKLSENLGTGLLKS